MKFDPDELVKLATLLDDRAKVAEAKAKEHANHLLEMDDRDRELARAKSARHYAVVCRYFADREKARQGRPHNQPTFEEVLEFVRGDERIRSWPEADIQRWYDHFEANGWKVSGKTTMKNWKAAARNGYARWREKHPLKAKASTTQSDPNGWTEFLTSARIPYREFRYAPDHWKTDFAKWRRK